MEWEDVEEQGDERESENKRLKRSSKSYYSMMKVEDMEGQEKESESENESSYYPIFYGELSRFSNTNPDEYVLMVLYGMKGRWITFKVLLGGFLW